MNLITLKQEGRDIIKTVGPEMGSTTQKNMEADIEALIDRVWAAAKEHEDLH